MPRGYRTQADRDRALARVVNLDRLLDRQFSLFGTKFTFGLDPIIGLVPVIGDLVMAALALYTIRVAWRCRVPFGTIIVMLLNVGFDLLVGEIPVAGDFFDFLYKANRINIRLLARHVALPPASAG